MKPSLLITWKLLFFGVIFHYFMLFYAFFIDFFKKSPKNSVFFYPFLVIFFNFLCFLAIFYDNLCQNVHFNRFFSVNCDCFAFSRLFLWKYRLFYDFFIKKSIFLCFFKFFLVNFLNFFVFFCVFYRRFV